MAEKKKPKIKLRDDERFQKEQEEKEEKTAQYSDNKCHCNDNCTCGEDCTCDDNCECGDDCECTPEHHCGCGGHFKEEKPNYLEIAQRIQADFENYKRRNKEVVRESFLNGVASSIEKLLPALDSFNQAIKSIDDSKVLEGVNLIYNQMKKALEELGVSKIDCIGKPFDPKFHNAVLVGEDYKKKNNIVLEEYQEGFILNEKVIRHSVVKINKLNQGEK